MIGYTDAARFAIALAFNLTLIGIPVALGVAASLKLARTAAPRARYIIAVAAFFAVSLLPLAMTIRAAREQVELAPTAVIKPGDRSAEASGANIAAAQRVRAEASVRTTSSIIAGVIDDLAGFVINSRLAPFFLALWVLISALLLGRESAGYVQLARARRTWKPAEEALREELSWPVDVPLFIDESEGPFAVGLFRAGVVLPAGLLTDLTPCAGRSIARHELAHVRWRDPLVNSLTRAVRALLWPSLPLWYLERAARFEREAAADRAAINPEEAHAGENISAADYVSALVSVARLSGRTPGDGRHTLVATKVGGGNLEERARRLLPTASRFTGARLSLACLALSASILGAFVVPAASQQQQPSSTSSHPTINGKASLESKAERISGSAEERDVWLLISEGGRRLEIRNGYSVSMNGGGKVNFKDEGRIMELPEGLNIFVDGKPVYVERRVREGEIVRITDGAGKTIWQLAAIPPANATKMDRPRTRLGGKTGTP